MKAVKAIRFPGGRATLSRSVSRADCRGGHGGRSQVIDSASVKYITFVLPPFRRVGGTAGSGGEAWLSAISCRPRDGNPNYETKCGVRNELFRLLFARSLQQNLELGGRSGRRLGRGRGLRRIHFADLPNELFRLLYASIISYNILIIIYLKAQ